MSNELKTVLEWILKDYQGISPKMTQITQDFPAYLQNGICFAIRHCPYNPREFQSGRLDLESLQDEFDDIVNACGILNRSGIFTHLYLYHTPYDCFLNHVPIWETAIKPRIDYLTKLLKDHVSAQQMEIPFGE
jgi:hypothetical protein